MQPLTMHANGWMLSNEIADIYSTSEPAAALPCPHSLLPGHPQ